MTKYKIPKKLLDEVAIKDKVTSIRFNEESWSILNEIAKEYHLNKSDVIRIALKNLAE